MWIVLTVPTIADVHGQREPIVYVKAKVLPHKLQASEGGIMGGGRGFLQFNEDIVLRGRNGTRSL